MVSRDVGLCFWGLVFFFLSFKFLTKFYVIFDTSEQIPRSWENKQCIQMTDCKRLSLSRWENALSIFCTSFLLKSCLLLSPQRVKPANYLAVLLGQHEGWLPLPRSDMTAPIWCAAIKGLLRAERPDGFVMRTVALQNGFPLPLPLLPSAAGPRHSRLPACHSMH